MKSYSRIAYRRNLPHLYLPERSYFLTWRLYQSLPQSLLRQQKAAYQQAKAHLLEKYGPQDGRFSEQLLLLNDTYERKINMLLDQARSGPRWLSRPEAALLVMESLHHIESEKRHWELLAYCIMSNHVHVVCTLRPAAPPLHKIMESHKKFTAIRINRMLGRSGKFWQPETYDRLIRRREDVREKMRYTLNNPVAAGLVKHWREWPYSYCHPDVEL